MNIFITHKNPEKAARCLANDPKRENRMILESFQIMYSALRLNGYTGEGYRLTHKDHPVVLWTAKDVRNMLWLYSYTFYLHKQWNKRTGKTHKSYLEHFIKIGLLINLKNLNVKIQDKNLVNCSMFKKKRNVFKAYRKTLKEKWKEDNKKIKTNK